MDVFQDLPSKSLPLCLTSWENQKKSANTSEKNCRPPQVWFILGNHFQMAEGTMLICTKKRKYKHHGCLYASINTMGPRSRHTAQEGDTSVS